MAEDFLNPRDAACRLGVTVTTLYDWLGKADRGLLEIQGESVTVDYFQTGPRGQGRIRIPAKEVERLLELMRVRPKQLSIRRPAVRRDNFPGITVPLGRPEN